MYNVKLKKMKKIGFLLFAILFGTVISMAQPGGQRMSPEERAKTQTAELKEKLGLDKAQEKKVYDLNLQAGKDMAKMRESMQSGDREGMREKMTKMREDQNKEMKKILTEDQYKKYEKYLEERRAQRGQGGGGNR